MTVIAPSWWPWYESEVTPLHVMVKRLLACWDTATEAQLHDGRVWYPNAKQEAKRISKATGVSHRRVVRVIAAVSPRQQWVVNLRSAEAICNGNSAGVIKTFAAVARLEVAGVKAINGRKSIDFDAAMWGDPDRSPIDRWTGGLVLGEKHMANRQLERVGWYDRAVQAHEVVAAQIGVAQSVLQATTWGIYRGRFV